MSYHADVLPILQANCQGCHQPAKASGKLDMTAFKNLLAAGESGSAAIVPGKPDESYLIEQITPRSKAKRRCRRTSRRWPASEIALIRRWIEEGARDDTPPDTTPPIDAEHPPVYSGPPVITSLDWSPNGELLAVAGFHEVLLHKADGSGLVARLVGMAERIESVRFSPDGTKLAVTGGRPAGRAKCRFGMSPSSKLLLSVPVTNDSIFGASWSPDGKRVAFGCTDKSVRAIDAETGEQVLFQQAHDDWVLGTTFSVDGSHLVSVGRDMTAKLIEVATQRFVDNITSITPGALKGGIQSVQAPSAPRRNLFGGADGTPRIYRMERDDRAADRRRCQPVVGAAAAARPGVQRRYHAATAASIAAGSSLDGHGHVHVYRMEPTPKIPDAIQAILNKPVPSALGRRNGAASQAFRARRANARPNSKWPKAACTPSR